MSVSEYKMQIEFPVTLNSEGPVIFSAEGKGWFAEELINWKIIMSEKTGVKTWLGGNDYAKKIVVLDVLGEYEFLGFVGDNSGKVFDFTIEHKLPKPIFDSWFLTFKELQ